MCNWCNWRQSQDQPVPLERLRDHTVEKSDWDLQDCDQARSIFLAAVHPLVVCFGLTPLACPLNCTPPGTPGVSLQQILLAQPSPFLPPEALLAPSTIYYQAKFSS